MISKSGFTDNEYVFNFIINKWDFIFKITTASLVYIHKVLTNVKYNLKGNKNM